MHFWETSNLQQNTLNQLQAPGGLQSSPRSISVKTFRKHEVICMSRLRFYKQSCMFMLQESSQTWRLSGFQIPVFQHLKSIMTKIS